METMLTPWCGYLNNEKLFMPAGNPSDYMYIYLLDVGGYSERGRLIIR